MSDSKPAVNWDNVRARVSADPFFLGWMLGEYTAAHQMSDQQLADVLQCSTQDLVRLSLCRLPDDSRPTFRVEIQRISEYTTCNANQLVMLIREVTAMKNMSGHGEERGAGFLIAARDYPACKKNTGRDDSEDQ